MRPFNSALPVWATSEMALYCCNRKKTLPSVKDLDRRIFPLLGDITRFANIDKDAVKATREFGVVEFQQFGRQRV